MRPSGLPITNRDGEAMSKDDKARRSGLHTSRTFLIHTGDGIIKVTPQGGRVNNIKAPRHVRLTDRKGRPLGRAKG
jgi:hypothetical protein